MSLGCSVQFSIQFERKSLRKTGASASQCQPVPASANPCQPVPASASQRQPVPASASQCQPVPTNVGAWHWLTMAAWLALTAVCQAYHIGSAKLAREVLAKVLKVVLVLRLKQLKNKCWI